MLSFFNRNKAAQLPPALPYLDSVFYPLLWQQHLFQSAPHFLQHLIDNLSVEPADLAISNGNQYPVSSLAGYQKQFSQLLLQQPLYQEWINFTVFGRYIQRSFSAFYRQTEDVFNAEMPEILKYELMRHTQRLPKGQVLLVGGKLPLSVRREKLLITTLNPFKAMVDALSAVASVNSPYVINIITANSDKVKAFAVKHNKYTSDGGRNEVMILDFNHLILTKEDTHKNNAQSERSYLIRHYIIG